MTYTKLVTMIEESLVPNINDKYPKGVDGSGNWISTFSGGYIYPLDPDPKDICIEDIAHSLSNQCRFTGHVKKFYSTGQHCVIASYLVPKEYALWALLHDASEAYISDIARPVKKAAEFGDFYLKAEDVLMQAVIERFGLENTLPMPDCVKKADDLMLWTEMRDLMPNDPPDGVEMLDTEIDPWTPEKAEASFIARYNALTSPSLP